MTTQPEVWLRGPIEGFEPLLMPAVHSLLQAREDIEDLVASVPAEHVWQRPGGAASIGFHVRHLGGALDRLLTYARSEMLSDAQRAAARAEREPGEPPESLGEAVAGAGASIDRALDQLRATTREDLLAPRKVGRLGLPSTTLGLIFHAAEHCTRHAGQAISTARILQGGSDA
ncbi:MAG: DinB family protein [Acidobacteria bacterium]|nr:DinB family protein [Acidobacteriota bacterium]